MPNLFAILYSIQVLEILAQRTVYIIWITCEERWAPSMDNAEC